MKITETSIRNILTRTSGFLETVASHSLQPYAGCSFGNSLCGAGCYVQHNRFITKGRAWGGFLDVRTNAAASYLANVNLARAQAEAAGIPFTIFMSSSTDPFLPQERRYGITKQVLDAMMDEPPDRLIVQTHSPLVAEYAGLLQSLSCRCSVQVNVSIETDRKSIPGLPPHSSPPRRRLDACRLLSQQGIETVVCVSPLLPIEHPREFFHQISQVAHAVVIDHFIGGDGSQNGFRTRQTLLVAAIEAVDPNAATLAYREQMVEIARHFLPGRVGVSIDGFAGRYLELHN